MALSTKQIENGKTLNIWMSGKIDEDAVLPPINFDRFDRIEIDLSGVQKLNSCGIRDWVRWLEPISAKCKIVYQNCPRPVVEQVNAVEGFLPNSGTVESFVIPYHCDSCDSESDRKVHMSGFDSAAVDEEIECGSCGKKAELDVLAAKYFQFLNRKTA